MPYFLVYLLVYFYGVEFALSRTCLEQDHFPKITEVFQMMGPVGHYPVKNRPQRPILPDPPIKGMYQKLYILPVLYICFKHFEYAVSSIQYQVLSIEY